MDVYSPVFLGWGPKIREKVRFMLGANMAEFQRRQRLREEGILSALWAPRFDGLSGTISNEFVNSSKNSLESYNVEVGSRRPAVLNPRNFEPRDFALSATDAKIVS